MEAIVERITDEEQRIAKSSAALLQESSDQLSNTKVEFATIKVQNQDEYLHIPKKAFFLLSEIIANMADGKSVSVVANGTDLTTQEAADILNVSRPYVVKLLEEGKIPFKKAGTHRRVGLDDVLAYKKEMKRTAMESLAFLTAQAQELNLGY
jgi:excisionase family DNA binding protein